MQLRSHWEGSQFQSNVTNIVDPATKKLWLLSRKKKKKFAESYKELRKTGGEMTKFIPISYGSNE